MAGKREKSRLPGGPRQQFAYGTGDRPEGTFSGRTSGGEVGADVWDRYPQLEEHRGTDFEVNPAGDVLSKNITSGQMEPFREQVGDIEMSDEDWEGFLAEIVRAASNEGGRGGERGFFQRMGDLLFPSGGY